MAKSAKKIKPPKGTRDLYPEDVLRQRYITNAWRDASIRCGFDEIAGPTFESTDLYAVKSGDGILGELFQAFSGKSEREIEKVKSTGQAEYALRPEFTPTLARMYAAKSKELPKPCKWFTAGPYFRAERPQRGRLREFLQWNVDVIGLPLSSASAQQQQCIEATIDSEIIQVCYQLISLLGITDTDVSCQVSDRRVVEAILMNQGFSKNQYEPIMGLLDQRSKLTPEQFAWTAGELGMSEAQIQEIDRLIEFVATHHWSHVMREMFPGDVENSPSLEHLFSTLDFVNVGQFVKPDLSIVRGIAYYTGMVFELIADGERAVAGGGRYDNLIELFGGPPTPACGFGMGDVVLSNLLDDKELIPDGLELMEAVARPQASIRPEAFIVPNGDEDNESLVHTLTANLRRGIESEQWSSRENRKPWNADRYAVAPLHARISYKSTRKTNKLRDDAMKQHAKFFIVINADDNAELHNLDTKESLGTFSTNPAADNYVGTAIAQRIQL